MRRPDLSGFEPVRQPGSPHPGKTTWHLVPTSWESCHPAHHCCMAYERGLSTGAHSPHAASSLWDRSCPVRSYVLAARIGPDLLGYAVQHACAYAKGPRAHMPCTRVCGRAGVTVMHAFPLAWHAYPPRWPPCRHVRVRYPTAACRGHAHARYTVSAGRRTRSIQPSRRHIADVIHRQVSLVCARHVPADPLSYILPSYRRRIRRHHHGVAAQDRAYLYIYAHDRVKGTRLYMCQQWF